MPRRRGSLITNLVIGGPEDYQGNPDPAHDVPGQIVNHKITITFEITIGRHVGACARCDCKTPPPTIAQLQAAGAGFLSALDGRYIAARGYDDNDGNYLPATWGSVDNQLLCGACLPIVQEALQEALKVEPRA